MKRAAGAENLKLAVTKHDFHAKCEAKRHTMRASICSSERSLSTRNFASPTLHVHGHVHVHVHVSFVCKLPSPQACEREISATGHIAFYGFANAAAPPLCTSEPRASDGNKTRF